MADQNIAGAPKQSWADPKAAPGSDEPWIVHTPTWHVVLRGFQVFFGFVIVVMAGLLIHGKAMDANAFAVVCGLFTWIIVTYALVTEKVASARKGYNIWAILSLDLFMAIFWMASMGANAAQRVSFNTRVTVESCYNDGSAVSSNFCTVSKRDGAAVASPTGLALMSAIAGLSALNWFLFVATLVFNGHTFRLYYQANKTPKPTDNATVEMKAQEAPMLDSQQQAYQQQQPYPQYTDHHQQYQSQVPVPQPTPSPGPNVSPSPAPTAQYTGYDSQPQQQYHGQQQQTYYEVPGAQHQHQQHQYPAGAGGAYPAQTYSPNSTPAQQGQPYYPPTQ